MTISAFIKKHKDTIKKGKEAAAAILKSNSNNTSLESFQVLIDSIKTRTFTVTEVFVNEIVKQYSPDITLKFYDGHCRLIAPNIEAKIAYHSCNFTGETRSITLKVLELKPFYYDWFLSFINKKFPFLACSKTDEKERLITCHLNEIPALASNKIITSLYLQYVTIDHLIFEECKAALKLKLKKEHLVSAVKERLLKRQNETTDQSIHV